MRLDLDVLELVCECLNDIRSVRSFSLLARALRPVGIKRLLSMRPVRLENEHALRIFHDFVFADSAARLPYIRGLWINIGRNEDEPPETLCQRLLNLLEKATRLESLEIPYPGFLLGYIGDPRLLAAIAHISTLRVLSIPDDVPSLPTIVKTTCSPLRILRVSLYSPHNPERWIKTYQLDDALRHLATTLEVLDLHDAVEFDSKGIQYPSLRSFSVASLEVSRRLDILMHKFPALDGTLDVGHHWRELQDDIPRQRRIRKSNKERQARTSWKHVDRFIGNTISLYIMGLTCPVRHLMVDGVCMHWKDLLTEILRDTPPTHLMLTLLLSHGEHVLDDLFPPEVVPRMTHLVIRMEYSNPYLDDDQADFASVQNARWKTLLSRLKSSICHLRLTHLRVMIEYDVGFVKERTACSTDLIRNIRHLDHRATAAELFSTVPSLRYIFLGSAGRMEVVLPSSGDKSASLTGAETGVEDDNGEDGHKRGDTYTDSEIDRQVTRGRFITSSAWEKARGQAAENAATVDTLKQLMDEEMKEMIQAEDLFLSKEDHDSPELDLKIPPEEREDWPIPE